jgi:hypothetical protein
VAAASGLVGLLCHAVDGTKIRAAASRRGLAEAPADEFLHRLGSGPPQLGQQLAASSSLAME